MGRQNNQTDGLSEYVARAARIADIHQLIVLHKAFKQDMRQWEHQSQQQASMDVEDAKYIILEEPGNLIVLSRPRGDGAEEQLIAFSYSYIEPFDSENHQRRNQQNGSPKMSTQGWKHSLYIAELYVDPSARGFGLGELLMFETLCRRAKQAFRSHLYVSSKNISAVRIYENYQFTSTGHSGDASHDLLMQLDGLWDGLSSRCGSIQRKFRQGIAGCATCQRRSYILRQHASSTDTLSSPGTKLVPPPFAPAACEWCIANPHLGQAEEEEAVRTRAGDARAALKARVGAKKKGSGVCTSQKQRYGKGAAITLKASPAAAPPDWARVGVKRGHKQLTGRVGASAGPDSEWDGASNLKKRARVFLLTGFTDAAELRRVEDGVRRLGGKLCQQRAHEVWACTHVVCPRPLPTEKFLSGLAAGKVMVSAAYVLDSVVAGRFLRDDGYEWGAVGATVTSENEVDSLSTLLAQAVRMWKEVRALELGGPGAKRCKFGCFEGMSAVVISSGEEGGESVRRLLAAGGADVRQSAETKRDTQGLSHAFITNELIIQNEELQAAWAVTPELVATVRALTVAGVAVLKSEYVADVLTLGPALDEAEYNVAASMEGTVH